MRTYFDTVRHDLLLMKVASRVNDGKILHLLKMILKASGRRGVPQLLKAACGSVKHLEIVEKYCAYDKRKRPNYPEKEARILTIMEKTVSLS